MSRTLLPVSLAVSLLGGAAFAEVPRVATDIAPVHSLVARVMEGVGTPDLIIQSGASPHAYSLRPSEAKALQEADLVFWVGPELTPWLEGAIKTLAKNATVSELLEADGAVILDYREGALFEKHGHAAQDHDGEDHSEEHAHDDHDGHDDHDDHAGHAHEGHDGHAWLSPQNGAVWLNVIAGQLSAADPENAGAYFANAASGRAELDALGAEISTMLEPIREGRFIVFHDAYQYFETHFGFTASGAISLGDSSDPSPARVAEIRDMVTSEGIKCVLSEPQFNPFLVATVTEGTPAKTGILDPLGSDLDLGPALYPQILRNLAKELVECF